MSSLHNTIIYNVWLNIACNKSRLPDVTERQNIVSYVQVLLK